MKRDQIANLWEKNSSAKGWLTRWHLEATPAHHCSYSNTTPRGGRGSGLCHHLQLWLPFAGGGTGEPTDSLLFRFATQTSSFSSVSWWFIFMSCQVLQYHPLSQKLFFCGVCFKKIMIIFFLGFYFCACRISLCLFFCFME